MKILTAVSIAAFFTVSSGFADTFNFDFSQPVTLSPTPAPGAWYTDRYAPNGFVSQATAPDGTQNTLQETISPADHQADNFQNTQGRDYSLPTNTVDLSISLYVDPTWGNTDEREAGFWIAGTDSTGTIQDYPIIEFQSAITTGKYANGGVAGFYGWDNTGAGSWDLITATNFAYGAWSNLDISIASGQLVYTVNGTSVDSPEGSPLTPETQFSTVLLQGYNGDNDTAPLANSYSIYWNDLSGDATPEPGTIVMMLSGIGLVFVGMRARRTSSARN